MKRFQLTLATLSQFDVGKPYEAFQVVLERAVRDMIDRPADRTERKVTMEVLLKPLTEQSGDLSDVEVQFRFKCTVPQLRTKAKTCAVTRNGQLIFPELFAEEEAHQTEE